MSNPWDRPILPARSDDSDSDTYAAVGQVLSKWEQIESELSHLYALFIGKMWTEEAYDQYYKTGHTGKRRLATLEEAANAHFRKNPNQQIEGNFCLLLKAASGFSERRHEAAHGIVRPVQWYWPFLKGMEIPPDNSFKFCLVPPHYQRSWFDNGLPEYIYTSVELDIISSAMYFFLHEILDFKHAHLPYPSPPPLPKRLG